LIAQRFNSGQVQISTLAKTCVHSPNLVSPSLNGVFLLQQFLIGTGVASYSLERSGDAVPFARRSNHDTRLFAAFCARDSNRAKSSYLMHGNATATLSSQRHGMDCSRISSDASSAPLGSCWGTLLRTLCPRPSKKARLR
jgi:hypothetical protein